MVRKLFLAEFAGRPILPVPLLPKLLPFPSLSLSLLLPLALHESEPPSPCGRPEALQLVPPTSSSNNSLLFTLFDQPSSIPVICSEPIPNFHRAARDAKIEFVRLVVCAGIQRLSINKTRDPREEYVPGPHFLLQESKLQLASDTGRSHLATLLLMLDVLG
ncbi:P2X purinoceptor 7 [Striga asiatica]|uniref:P2X purinoceptor 7 n=1 Tax=Striga asiatica TaxID=4170 RepID=A0A5A7PP12_STRAF|nr:P2X purinoceptor 7 [Striga asiatica]